MTWKRPPAGKRWVHFIDVETGGQGDPPIYPVTQIAAITVDWISLEELERFEVKLQVNPDELTEEALKVNSFDPEVWEREAVPRLTAAERFDAYLERYSSAEKTAASGSTYWLAEMAGWNSADFDHRALAKLYSELPDPRGKHEHRFLPIAFDVLDSMHLARWLGKRQTRDHKLETFADHLGIPREPEAHDALAGAELCLEVTRVLRGRVVESRVALELCLEWLERFSAGFPLPDPLQPDELAGLIETGNQALGRCGKPAEKPVDEPAEGSGG